MPDAWPRPRGRDPLLGLAQTHHEFLAVEINVCPFCLRLETREKFESLGELARFDVQPAFVHREFDAPPSTALYVRRLAVQARARSRASVVANTP